MAYYAFLDKNNIVTEVIAGVDENITQIDSDGSSVGGSSEAWEKWYENFRGQVCKRTSFNGNYRKNYAGIGYFYDELKDAFIAPKPYSSWILNEQSCIWEAPVPYPNDKNNYFWNESKQSWDEVK